MDNTNPFEKKPYGTFAAQTDPNGKPSLQHLPEEGEGEVSDTKSVPSDSKDSKPQNGTVPYERLKEEEQEKEHKATAASAESAD